MSPPNIDESLDEIPSRPPEIRINPSDHIVSQMLPDPEGTPSEREREQLDEDSYFPPHDSVLVVDGLSVFNDFTKDYDIKVKAYNKQLADLRLPYRIRSVHKHVYRHFTYYYFGHYIYTVTKPETSIVQLPITDTSLPVKKTAGKKRPKKKPAKKKENNIKWIYLSKFDELDWHKLIQKDKLIELGMPPRLDIPNLKFHVTQVRLPSSIDEKNDKGVESIDTNTIIMPYLLYMNPQVKFLFKGYPSYRLSSRV